MPDHICGSFRVGSEAQFSAGRILIKISSEVNDGVVIRDQPNVSGVKNVASRAAGKIIGGEKPANMGAEIAAAAGN
jgi:hypothetical protein